MGPHHENNNKTFDIPHFDLFGSDHWTIAMASLESLLLT